MGSYTQWAEGDGGVYTPVGKTVAQLEPGYYDPMMTMQGQLLFVPVRARADELLRFPDSASLAVVDGIVDFWEREDLFYRYDLPYKRGILLYGPPGSGKTCTLQLAAREVVARGGVVVSFESPDVFLTAYRALRDVQPETPLVVLMEDFETLLAKRESKVLNLLDGVESLHKVVFLATTNYLERLEPRIINRPSRFDIRIKVARPTAEQRRLYLQDLKRDGDVIDIDRMVADTDELSLAHVKELFVATHILGADYYATVARLREMQEKRPHSSEDSASGFVENTGNYL